MKRVHVHPAILAALILATLGGLAAALTVGLTTSTPPKPTAAAIVVKAKAATEAVKAPAVVVNQHVCTPKDSTMGCVLALPQNATPPAADALAEIRHAGNAASSGPQGIDFGWSCPLSQAKNFGASYISTDSSKNWSRSCVDSFHRAGKATVAVWETSANRAQDGSSAGQSDVHAAIAQLNALGAGPHQPVLLAIDCDCAGSSLASYFQGANSANGSHPIEAYGGYDQLLYLSQHHLIGHANWQTYAWSGGRWLSSSIAPLEQYLNSSSVDYDRAIAAYYGQWPYKGKSPNPPRPSGPVCFGNGYAHTSFCSKVRAQDAARGAQVAKEEGYVRISEHNLATIEGVDSDSRPGGRLGIELAKIKTLRGALEASLRKYGCHAKGGHCQ